MNRARARSAVERPVARTVSCNVRLLDETPPQPAAPIIINGASSSATNIDNGRMRSPVIRRAIPLCDPWAVNDLCGDMRSGSKRSPPVRVPHPSLRLAASGGSTETTSALSCGCTIAQLRHGGSPLPPSRNRAERSLVVAIAVSLAGLAFGRAKPPRRSIAVTPASSRAPPGSSTRAAPAATTTRAREVRCRAASPGTGSGRGGAPGIAGSRPRRHPRDSGQPRPRRHPRDRGQPGPRRHHRDSGQPRARRHHRDRG